MANEIVPYNTSKALQEVDRLRALIAWRVSEARTMLASVTQFLQANGLFPSFYALQLRNKRSAEELRSHAPPAQ